MTQAPSKLPSTAFNFWNWLIKIGLFQFLDKWLIFHLIIGFLFQHFLKMPLYELAWKLIIPFAAILVAIVFAWSGNISTLLQTKEMDLFRRRNNFDTYINYIFNFQLVALVNLTLIILWSLLGLDPFHGIKIQYSIYAIGRTLVFAFTSLAVRECWTMILRLQLHLIQNTLIKDAKYKARRKKIKLKLHNIFKFHNTD
jgi:hypothetical protein